MKLPKVGNRVKIKSLGIKGRIFYVDEPTLFAGHMQPIQVELDKPYDKHGQKMYRTDLKDIVILKKKAEDAPTPKKKKEKVEEMQDLNRIEEFQVGESYMLFIKKKTTIEPTRAKIIKISDEGVRCYLTHKDETKKKTIPVDKFLKQYRRAFEQLIAAGMVVKKPRKKKKPVVEEEFDWS